jgi:hypothetical protein
MRSGELDVGLVRERPAGSEFDALLVARGNLGVLLESAVAGRLVGPDGIRLDDLGALRWVGFPRSASSAWYDELMSILRSHGIDIGPTHDDQELIAVVKFTAVSGGHAFALAPENQLRPLPDNVTWAPLVGQPAVRRTWVGMAGRLAPPRYRPPRLRRLSYQRHLTRADSRRRSVASSRRLIRAPSGGLPVRRA